MQHKSTLPGDNSGHPSSGAIGPVAGIGASEAPRLLPIRPILFRLGPMPVEPAKPSVRPATSPNLRLLDAPATVQALRSGVLPRAATALDDELACRPSHVRALRSGDWKLVRHCDPWTDTPKPDQWELYHLASDPQEARNLLVHDGAFPMAIDTMRLPDGVSQQQVVDAARRLHQHLSRQEAALRALYPKG
ncbi:MAG: hypothetical protein R3F12_06510 [Lysobacteraceae bacterium]